MTPVTLVVLMLVIGVARTIGLIRRLAWPLVLAILAIGLHVIGWGRIGHAAFTAARGIAEVTWPAIRLLWPGLVVLVIAGLLSRRGRALLGRVRIGIRFSWLVGGVALAVFGLVVLSLLVFPGYLVQRTLDATGTPALRSLSTLVRQVSREIAEAPPLG